MQYMVEPQRKCRWNVDEDKAIAKQQNLENGEQAAFLDVHPGVESLQRCEQVEPGRDMYYAAFEKQFIDMIRVLDGFSQGVAGGRVKL